MAQRSAPLAGRPPYATDDDDSVFETSPAPSRTRLPRPPVDNPNARTSAYNTYDNYLDNRDSRGDASAGIGGALLAIDSDSDDETDLHSVPPQRNADNSGRAGLYAAAAQMNSPTLSPTSPTRTPTSPAPPYSPPASGRMPTDTKPVPGAGAPLSANPSSSRTPSPTGQSSLVSPRPVYAPNSPSRQAAFDVHSSQQQQPPALNVQIPAPPSANLRAEFDARGPAKPTAAFMAPPANGGAGTPSSAGFGSIPGTPNEGLHPHPLQAPSTPITPVFAAPPRVVNFEDKSSTPILRGNKEETLLARRGEKGDDFWRRFSMVAKQENAKPATQKTSQWLKGAQSRQSSMSRCIWIVAIILLICIAGSIGAGWYFTHNNPEHTRPKTFGGSAEEGMNGPGASSTPATTTSSHTGGLVKITHASTSVRPSTTAVVPTAAPTDLRRSENLIARAFGQEQKQDDLPVAVKKIRRHQQGKRRAWDRVM